MLYQFKNFRTREMVDKITKKEVSELFKLVILLVILNLVLLSFYSSEKTKYPTEIAKFNSYNENKNSDDVLSENNIRRKNTIINLINDERVSSLCSSITYSDNIFKIECVPNKFDELVGGLNNHKNLKKDEIEGDSSKISLKLVLK